MSIVEAPAQLQAWIDELGDEIAVLSTRRYKLIDALNALNVSPAPAPAAAVKVKVQREPAKRTSPANQRRRSKYDLAAIAKAARDGVKVGTSARDAVQALYPSASHQMVGWLMTRARKEGFEMPASRPGRSVHPSAPEATVTAISAAPSAPSLGGRQPTVNYVEIAQLIAKRYGIPPSTAKNWMARCREQGLIKPLTAGLRVVEDNTVDPDQSAAAVYDGRAVAEQYLAAIRQNTRPIQSVADLFDIDKQLAAQWVRRARADGELPPAAEPQLPEQERRAMLDATKSGLV